MKFHQFIHSQRSQSPHLLLIGSPVAQSLSPVMHNRAAGYYDIDWTYYAVDVDPADLGRLASHLNSEHFKGANVTIPYKEILMDYVDRLDTSAGSIGALNTIVPENGELIGYNTDLYGFLEPLQPHQNELDRYRAVVFGTGGAAKAIVQGLREMDFEEIVLISRNPGKVSFFDRYEEVAVHHYDAWSGFAEEASLIVNATPLGMEPNTDTCPIREAEKQFLANRICYDIVYKPRKTRFLQLAEEAGATTIGGLDMLMYQGSRSFELWTGHSFPVEMIKKELYEYLEKKN